MRREYMNRLIDNKPELPAPSSWAAIATRIWDYGWPRFRKWMEKQKDENRICVRLYDLSIYVSEIDRGRVDFRMDVVNFSRKNLTLDYIELRFWKIGYHALNDQSNLINASGRIDKHSIGNGYFNISLLSSDIRDIVKGIEAAQNNKLTPRAIFELNGHCIFNFQKRPIRIPFIFNHQCNSINIPINILEQ